MKNYHEPISSIFTHEAVEMVNPGLTKLEMMSANAMQAILSNADTMREITKGWERKNGNSAEPIEFAEAIGRLSVLYAKGLLNELEKEVANG